MCRPEFENLPDAETDDYRAGWQSSFDNLDVALAR